MEDADEAYRRHLAGLRGVLPDRVLDLVDSVWTHDALVARVDHDRELRRLRLVLRCGDVQAGYYNLVLTYKDAELLPEDDLVLARIARSTESSTVHGCDLANHEVTMAEDGRIEHNMIFHALAWEHPDAGGWLWFSIRCRTLDWRLEPRRTRRLPPSNDRYPGGPDTSKYLIHRTK